MYARCMSIDRWYWRLVRGRCATTTRTQSPESLSSIQCLGALSLLRCFLGPRVYEKEAEAITYTTASGERDTTQIVGIGSQSRHHVEYGSRSSIARSRCGTIVRYLTDERWTTMRGFDVSRGKEERLDATKEQKSITDTRATPSSPRSLTGPLVLLRVPRACNASQELTVAFLCSSPLVSFPPTTHRTSNGFTRWIGARWS